MQVLYEDNHIIIVNKASSEIVQGDKTGDITSKALERLNSMFREGGRIKKTYWAIVKNCPTKLEAELVHYLIRNEQKNKSYAYHSERNNAKRSVLSYRVLGSMKNYHLLEVSLQTGRHHQIRCQLAEIGSPIKGDLKYGAERSNPDGSICLHARRIQFEHPVSKQMIDVVAPVPEDSLWHDAEALTFN